MAKDVYQRLAERLDESALGFTATESGIELKLLQKLFTEKEAEMYLALTLGLEPAEAIAERAGCGVEEATELLEAITAKGATFPTFVGDKKLYAAAPFMHGIFENNAFLQDDKEIAELMDAYLLGGFQAKGKALRTIPVNASLSGQKNVATFDDVIKIIESKERIGVMPCPCNSHMKTLDSSCERPNEVCLGFDFYAEYCVEGLGVGRWITREEALEIVKKADEAGLVHQTGGDTINTEALCNCCPDCCTSLRTIKMYKSPAKIAASNYHAQVSLDDCTQCETCLGRCPMGALTMADDELSVNLARCIGCGLCTTGCPVEAIVLVQNAPERLTGPEPPERAVFMKPSREYAEEVKRWSESK